MRVIIRFIASLLHFNKYRAEVLYWLLESFHDCFSFTSFSCSTMIKPSINLPPSRIATKRLRLANQQISTGFRQSVKQGIINRANRPP